MPAASTTEAAALGMLAVVRLRQGLTIFKRLGALYEIGRVRALLGEE